MKKAILFAAIVMMVGFSTTAMAITDPNTKATINAFAGVKLIVPMGLSKTSDLNFGSITLLNTTAAGTVVLSTTSIVPVYSTSMAASASNASAVTNAAYTVSGTLSSVYNLTLPTTVSVTSGSATMTITDFTARFNGAGSDATQSTLTALGADNFKVGATLNVAIAQAGGVYAGNFDVTVDYN